MEAGGQAHILSGNASQPVDSQPVDKKTGGQAHISGGERSWWTEKLVDRHTSLSRKKLVDRHTSLSGKLTSLHRPLRTPEDHTWGSSPLRNGYIGAYEQDSSTPPRQPLGR
jgi:hypothetical protein